MYKLRFMSHYRIPPSLKWLIRNQQTISGRLKNAKVELVNNQFKLEDANRIIQRHQELSTLVSILQTDLIAIEHSIGLHEIPIDISGIRPVNPHKNRPIFKHGELTRLTFSALSKKSQEWLTTTDIVAYVIANTNFEGDEPSIVKIRVVVSNKLRTLFHQGKVERVLIGNPVREGLWRQKTSSYSHATRSESHIANDALANNDENSQIFQI